MSDLENVKVGDLLCVSSRWSSRGHLEKVMRVTPTGRVITSSGEYNPNGRRRGDSGYDASRARLATADDIAGINRSILVEKLRRFDWNKLSAEHLKIVGDMVAGYSTGTTP